MDIAIHLGAHCTDEDLILRTLADNAPLMARNGVALPAPNKARPALRKALQAGGNLVPGMGNPLVGELLDGHDGSRMVLSYEGFLGTYATVLSGPSMYPAAGQRCTMLRDLFPGHAVSFFLALRNPATLIPALFEASSVTDFGAFVNGHDLSAITWSEPIAAIRAACPEVPLTVWCNEDLPMIWTDVLEAISGVEGPKIGDLAILEQIMTDPGIARLKTYLADNPPANSATRRKVITAFLGKYADDSKVAPEIAQPGWTDEMIAGLSNLYEQDVARVKAMGDITFIAP
ncbi:hypothetical protein [Jannaschia pohangensis]|uniref:hypothetical protein n=1 Tax=Jannaschia pohangensis TaxID=390807 RepID=UPI000B8943F3|nr:hypothetical protein [Jannaschia pohangensis]